MSDRRYFNPLSFSDVREVLDRALESPKGIRVPCETPGKAMHLRQRMNYYRAQDRKSMYEVFGADDARRGRSAFDTLIFTVDGSSVLVKKIAEGQIKVEEL